MEILCFFAGIVFVYTLSFKALILPALFIALSLRWQPLGWFVGAMLWALFHLYCTAERGMPPVRVLPNVPIEGQVASIPQTTQAKSQFQFLITKIDGKPASSLILLSCYNRCPHFKAGQIWRLNAKLKKPQNPGNPGSFNYKAWLDSRHLAWTGYIRNKTLHLIEGQGSRTALLMLRERLGDDLAGKIADPHILGIVQALTLGIGSSLDKADWDLFRRTGTTHLMVISGAHIGLIAGLCYWLSIRLWSRAGTLCLRYPANKAASLVSLLMALIYALLAGFAAPAQRALIACFLMSLNYFFSSRITAWQSWRYGLLLVLLYEPHVVLLSGFYFSFLAVAILILCSQRFQVRGIRQTLLLQLACLLGLMPLSLYWFSYGALNGFIANLMAIPWVGFVVVPLSLLGLVVVELTNSTLILSMAQWSIKLLSAYLHWVDSLARLNLTFTFAGIGSPLILLAMLLIAVTMPIKKTAIVLLIFILTALFPGYPHVDPGGLQIDVLDVGQGLAVLVRTEKHQLLYDTGVKFYQGGDMGQLAIIPYLTTLGIKRLDTIVISHPDLDHRGGLESIEKLIAVNELLVDKPAFYHRGQNCHQKTAWHWDGVDFQFLAIDEQFRDKNNSSCILQIKTANQTILLTGDIEKRAEKFLLQHHRKQLKANLLLIPHHGSRTSSTPAFIKAVSPDYAIISSGFDNRYHFPHPVTLNTLNNFKVPVYNTAECGMISYRVDRKGRGAEPRCFVRNH